MNEKTELTMSECVDLLGVSKYRVQQLIQEGKLEPVYHKNTDGKKGRTRNITLVSVARYAKNHKNL